MVTSSSPQKATPVRIGPRFENRYVYPFFLRAFDPGGTTGWAAVQFDGGMSQDITLEQLQLSVGELGPGEHHSALFDCLTFDVKTCAETGSKLHLVTEAFTFRQYATDDSYGKAKVELISCEYIGIIKLVAEAFDVPIASFMSSEGKGFATDLKLDKLGWFQKPKTPMRHRNDAVRQAVCYLIKKLHIIEPITSHWRD